MGQTVIDVYPYTVTTPPGLTSLACYIVYPMLLLPPICSLPDAITGLTVGDVQVYGLNGSLQAVMQITTDENGNPLEQYFTTVNSAGAPTPQPTLLARLTFNGSGEADYFAAGVEFRLFAAEPLGPEYVTPINEKEQSGPQTFNVVAMDPNGATDIQAVYLIFGSSTPPAPASCFVAYVPYGNALYLFNDADTGVVTGSPITAGTSNTLSNSQCTLSGSGGTATFLGNNLTVPFNITFMTGFIGTQTVYGLVQSYSGARSPWVNLGNLTLQP